jgi:hypothetical protein
LQLLELLELPTFSLNSCIIAGWDSWTNVMRREIIILRIFLSLSMMIINTTVCINWALSSCLANGKLLSKLRAVSGRNNRLSCGTGNTSVHSNITMSTSKRHVCSCWVVCSSILTQTSDSFSFKKSVRSSSLRGIYMQIIYHALNIFNIMRLVLLIIILLEVSNCFHFCKWVCSSICLSHYLRLI